MREQVIDSIADPTSFSDQRSLALAQWCGDRALIEIGHLIPAENRVPGSISRDIDDLARSFNRDGRNASPRPMVLDGHHDGHGCRLPGRGG